MAKLKKKAWVRYDGSVENGTDRYTLLVWSDEDCEWQEDMTVPFVADAKRPEAGRLFVHYSLVVRIIELAGQGYEIDI